MADPNIPVVSQSPNVEPPQQPQGTPQLAKPAAKSRGHVWAQRFGALVFVFLCAVMGVLLVIVPWWPQWTDNGLMVRYPQLRAVMASGFFRGICSGLGLLDIWIGFWEAVHYREEEHP